MVNPETGRAEYGWDGNGNLTSQTDALERTTTFEYDPLDHRTLRTNPGGTAVSTHDYDAIDRLLVETDRFGQQITHTYDPKSLPRA